MEVTRSMGYRIATLLLGSVALADTGLIAWGASPKSIHSVTLAVRPPRPGESAQFVRLPSDRTGIDFVHRWNPGPRPEHQRQIENSFAGGGVCIGDYDGDERPDIFFTSPHGGNRLYRNLGQWRFEDVTHSTGLSKGHSTWGTGATFADVNGDGHLDLYVCGYDTPNRLYINRGDGTFASQSTAAGLAFHGASIMMAFADYDNDGDLDGYLLTNRLSPPDGTKPHIKLRNGRWSVPPSQRELFDVVMRRDQTALVINVGQRDRLYRNNGDGTFTDVSNEAGITGNHYGLSATWWDFNGDRQPDLYVSNDFWGPDFLYRNNGDGTFTNVIETAVGHTPWFSMGSDTADINNDGMLDFMASDMWGTNHFKQKVSMGEMDTDGWFLEHPTPRQYMRNALYVNTGTDRFFEAATMAGLDATDWSWSIKFGDLDNDGRVDVFVANGMTRDWFNSDLTAELNRRFGPESRYLDVLHFALRSPVRRDANMAFRNRGDLQFDHVGPAWGLDYEGASFGAALADLDRDGDLDLVVNNFEEPPCVYRNLESQHHRVLIRLKGTASNRDGIGAIVRVKTRTETQMRYLTLARGYVSANEPRIHFGLGSLDTIERLIVQWPSGHRQTFSHLPADRYYTITEPASPTGPPQEVDEPAPLFRRSGALSGIRHLEKPFNDYRRQPLLPNKLSQLGPGMAWGDIDGDGDEDLFVGGAADRPGRLYRNAGHGRFERAWSDALMADQPHEDMGALFLDADGDDDMDLYVVSGGVECPAGDELLRDRLYLNDGVGHYTAAPLAALPEARDSGSVVCAADFDRDGDLDLFVGGRSIPGQYPHTPQSRLLRNDWPDRSGFLDVTDALAPRLRYSGMVTSALWSDADGDGWMDLLISHEWGPVRLFRYDPNTGKFVDQTQAAGLAQRLGWFNSIAAGDLDHDGDMDYVVTNFGLNTKYRASDQEPVLLYYGDLEGTGSLRLIEATYEQGVCYPVRGRSCSTKAMPALGQRFPTFEWFARATLQQIYTQDRLESAGCLQVNSLESGILINDGHGRFAFRPLPRLAQISAGFGVVVSDLDADTHADLCIAQNFFSPQRETGHLDGGVGLVLTGRGDGTFTAMWPNQSGVVIPGDAMSMTITDIHGDGWPDLVVGVNDGELLAFENMTVPGHRRLHVRLDGRGPNRTAVGARVTVRLTDGRTMTAERHAGGGYLSQSTRYLSFGLGRQGQVSGIKVRWPDGSTTHSRTKDVESPSIVIKQP